MRHYTPPAYKHSLREFLNAAARRRSWYRKAAWSVMLMVMLYVALGLHQAHAVVPYRSPEDYGPSIEARHHLPGCRRAAMEAMAGIGKIESESFVQRNDAEYFRFVMRNGTREVLIICDGRTGVIRRNIDIWGDL